MKDISIIPEKDLTVSKLTKAELSWIKKLQKILSLCPERLELVTIGDPGLSIVDRDGAKKSEIGDGAAARDGIVLAIIDGGPIIHRVSG